MAKFKPANSEIMATVSIYLNFPRNTEEAFNFYKSVFGTDYVGEGIMRFKDVPQSPEMPPLPDFRQKPGNARFTASSRWI